MEKNVYAGHVGPGGIFCTCCVPFNKNGGNSRRARAAYLRRRFFRGLRRIANRNAIRDQE